MTAVAYQLSPAQLAAQPRPAIAAPVAVPAPAPIVPKAYSRVRQPLGDPTPLVCTVAKAAIECVLGADSGSSLIRWVSTEVRTSLLKQHSLARRASYALKGQVGIARVRVVRVGPAACEAAIVAHEGAKVRAVAMRLEAVSGRWLITALDIG